MALRDSGGESSRGGVFTRIAVVCALSAAGLAVLALGAWVFGEWRLVALGHDYVPMAPSTAVLMALTGIAIAVQVGGGPGAFARVFPPVAALMVLAVGALLWAQGAVGFDLPLERWLSPTEETVGGIPVGRISPLTAWAFIAISTALLLQGPWPTRPSWRRVVAGVLALVGLLTGLAIVLGYASETPFLYDGPTVPMALLTAASFMLVCVALLLGAGREGWLLSVFLDKPGRPATRRIGAELVLLFLLLAVSILGSGLFFVRRQQVAARTTQRNELEAIADLKVGQIAGWLKERRNDAEIFRRDHDLQQFLADPSSAATRAEVLEWMTTVQRVYDYAAVVLFDSGGAPLLEVPAGTPTDDAHFSEHIRPGLSAQEVVVASFHRPQPGGPIYLCLLAPINLGLHSDRPADGLLLVVLDPYRSLYPLIQDWPTPSRTAETLLVEREGAEVVYLNELRHRSNAPLSLRRPVHDVGRLSATSGKSGGFRCSECHENPAKARVRATTEGPGPEGSFEGRDYRGEPVVAVMRMVPDSPWFMLAKVDQAEIYAPLRREALSVGGLTGALLLAATLGVGLLWRQREAAATVKELAIEHDRRALAERVAHLMRHANDIILLADESGRIVEANERAVESFGYPLVDLLRMTLGELRVPEERGKVAGQFERLKATGSAIFETVYQRQDGSPFPVEVSARHIEIGGVGHTLAIVRDITEQKRASEEIAVLGAGLAAAANAIVIAERDGRILWVNPAFTRLTGYSFDEAVGQNPRILKSRVHDAAFYRALWTRLASGEVWTGEIVNRRKDGSLYTEEMTVTPVHQNGILTHYIAIKQDVSERKQTEAALRLQSEIARNIAEGIYLVSVKDLTIVYANSRMEQMFGYGPGEMTGQPVAILNASKGGDPEQTARQIAAAVAKTGSYRGDVLTVRKDGLPFWSHTTISTAHHPEFGDVYVSLQMDITDRKRAEETLLRAQKLEALGTLAGGIAHDFNNILLAITGNTKLAADDLAPDHPAQESLREIAKASTRAVDLVRRILAFSRTQDQKREVMALRPAVEEALRLVRATLPAMIEIRSSFADDLPAVVADPTQIHQIIVNLATNAAHAIGTGSGHVDVRLTALDVVDVPNLSEGRYLELTVSDTGCGIDRATMARIFDPFFTTKPPGVGTGLGLSLVHGIVKSYGGAITVESQPGKGASFRVYFPAVVEATGVPRPAPQAVRRGHGERILYVDDEAPLVFLAARMLERLGYTVNGYTDAAKAVRAFRERPNDFDVVVTDLAMPGMSGFELVQALQAIKPDVSIVMTTGYVRQEEEDRARQLGIRALILKPDTIEELGEVLAHELVVTRQFDGGPAPGPAAGTG